MKKLLVLTALLTLTASAALAGSTPGTGIVGSAHDMTGYPGITDPQDRVCAFCHTPHHADVITHDYMPLWSRETTQVATFTPYSSTTLQRTLEADFMVGPSILCMSCHDGAVAPDAYYGNPGTGTLLVGDDYNEWGVGLAGNMTNDHPIGFDYTTVAAGDNFGISSGAGDPEILKADVTLTTRTDLDGSVYGISTINEVLWSDNGLGSGNIFTCESCHDVHNGSTVEENYFLYGPQAQSQFCRMCHLK